MVQEVSWSILSGAIDYYKIRGYKYIEVPWTVSKEPYRATKPEGCQDFETLDGYLVASGEQSFMEMMPLQATKAVCCTPCFRDESQLDNLHLRTFMKVELINTDASEENLFYLMDDALWYFHLLGLKVKVVEMPDGSKDINHAETNIELGSYGIRHWNGFSWVYGTGVAEPRTSTVMKV